MSNERAAAKRVRQAGFTLVEILVAIAILGILGSIAIKEVFEYIDEAKQEATKAKCDNIANICRDYKRKHHTLPSTLDVLSEPDERRAGGGPWCSPADLYDSWERLLEIKFGERSGEFEILSYGENGEPDGFTRDYGWDMDISSSRPLGDNLGQD